MIENNANIKVYGKEYKLNETSVGGRKNANYYGELDPFTKRKKANNSENDELDQAGESVMETNVKDEYDSDTNTQNTKKVNNQRVSQSVVKKPQNVNNNQGQNQNHNHNQNHNQNQNKKQVTQGNNNTNKGQSSISNKKPTNDSNQNNVKKVNSSSNHNTNTKSSNVNNSNQKTKNTNNTNLPLNEDDELNDNIEGGVDSDDEHAVKNNVINNNSEIYSLKKNKNN